MCGRALCKVIVLVIVMDSWRVVRTYMFYGDDPRTCRDQRKKSRRMTSGDMGRVKRIIKAVKSINSKICQFFILDES